MDSCEYLRTYFKFTFFRFLYSHMLIVFKMSTICMEHFDFNSSKNINVSIDDVKSAIHIIKFISNNIISIYIIFSSSGYSLSFFLRILIVFIQPLTKPTGLTSFSMLNHTHLFFKTVFKSNNQYLSSVQCIKWQC